MAERRMFAKSIVLSDAFLDMPMSARCLYFTMGMLADDDGFVGSPKSIMRQCGATDDDMKILLAKRYVLGFESGIIVIKHWRMNNYLQNDRHKTTTYLDEFATLSIDNKGAYTEKNNVCIQNVYTGKVSIGKNSIGKVSINNKEINKEDEEPIDIFEYDWVHDNDNIDKTNNNEKDIDVSSSIFDIYQNEIGSLSSRQYEKINNYLNQLNIELIKEAIYRTADANAKSFKYFETIVKDWINKGYKTIGDIPNLKSNRKRISEPVWLDKPIEKEASLVTDEDRREFEID